MPVHQDAHAVLAFWFDEVGPKRWFAKDAALDTAIGRRFGLLREEVVASKARDWRSRFENALAAIILIDQFGRNIFRGKPQAFAADPLARDLTRIVLDAGGLEARSPHERQFALLPLMHSESLADQDRSLIEFARLGDPGIGDFVQKHHDQIARFGRFPGRNAALGRVSTEAETDALANGAAF